ncbi:MAG: MBOAT family protein [Leptolinea sp.]|nr:MBOAT family protein [Leptolinea sp.]
MNFSSPLFLFAFLPLTLAVYRIVGDRWRPAVFTAASLFFCLWAGPLLFPVILLSTGVNFFLGKSIQKQQDMGLNPRRLLTGGIAFNIFLMLGFKFLVAYGPAWIMEFNSIYPEMILARLEPYVLKSISLPVGISFYSFQAVAYLLDIAAARVPAENNLLYFTEYMTAFPRITAGPITRYRDQIQQLGHRPFDVHLAGIGVNRFIIGLAKKTIIADRLSLMVDRGVFDQALPNLSTPSAWLVLVCYTLQIYFDFSGYSDMAIGLGMIFGLKFPENFNHPYTAASITEFWRRWHMTLSGWFREVVFFPLERKRASGSRWLNTYTNILIVFFLTGLWHGVTVNFLIWGVLHGMVICLENSPVGLFLRRVPFFLRNAGTLLVVMAAWVFFRSNSPAFAFAFLQNLVGLNPEGITTPYSVLPPMTASLWITLGLGLAFSFPVYGWLKARFAWMDAKSQTWGQAVLSLILLTVCLIFVAGSTFQPYIYGNF